FFTSFFSFFGFSVLSTFSATHSILAIGALSPSLNPSFTILVYPPLLVVYLGATSSKSTLSAFFDLNFAFTLFRLLKLLPLLALVTSFSTYGCTYLALARVVSILPSIINDLDKFLINAIL